MNRAAGFTTVAAMIAIMAMPASVSASHEFTKAANEACKSYQPALDDIADRAKEVRTDRGRANVFDDTADLLRELAVDLSDIEPPARKRKRFRGLLRAFREVAHYYGRAADRFRQGRPERALRDVERGVKSSERGVRLANRLGLYACGSG